MPTIKVIKFVRGPWNKRVYWSNNGMIWLKNYKHTFELVWRTPPIRCLDLGKSKKGGGGGGRKLVYFLRFRLDSEGRAHDFNSFVSAILESYTPFPNLGAPITHRWTNNGLTD